MPHVRNNILRKMVQSCTYSILLVLYCNIYCFQNGIDTNAQMIVHLPLTQTVLIILFDVLLNNICMNEFVLLIAFGSNDSGCIQVKLFSSMGSYFIDPSTILIEQIFECKL